MKKPLPSVILGATLILILGRPAYASPLALDRDGDKLIAGLSEGDELAFQSVQGSGGDGSPVTPTGGSACAGHNLFSAVSSIDTHLIDSSGNTVHNWSSTYRPALSVGVFSGGRHTAATGQDNRIQPSPRVVPGDVSSGSVGTWKSSRPWKRTVVTQTLVRTGRLARPGHTLRRRRLTSVPRTSPGSQRLPSGSTLICDGPAGRFFEVRTDGEQVWKYDRGGSVFRVERYGHDYSGFEGRGLELNGDWIVSRHEPAAA